MVSVLLTQKIYNQNNMNIALITFKLRAEWVHSLKEKRMIVKSLKSKLINKFHVSVAETGDQDIHQIIVISIAFIILSIKDADSIMERISLFVEENCDAEIIDEKREIR